VGKVLSDLAWCVAAVIGLLYGLKLIFLQAAA